MLAPFYPNNNPDVKTPSPGWASPNLYTRLSQQQIQNNLRWINFFSTAQPGQASLLLQTKNAAGQWVDTEVDGSALRNYDTDFSLAPAAKPHWQQGLRGMLSTAGTAAAKGDRNATLFSVESTNRGARVVIDDFDVCHDSIELVNPTTLKKTPLSPINLANYVQQSKALLRDHNISLNAAPELRSQKRAVKITGQDWSKANGTSTGFALNASDLFFDPDNLPGSNKGQSLRFTAYNEAIPWLKLNKGQLVLDPSGLTGKSAPSPGQYSFAVCATDGTARSDYLYFSLSYEPKVTVGSQQVPAGSQATFAFSKPGASALELYGQVVDAKGTALESARLIATQVGNTKAIPQGFGLAAATGSISDAYCAGSLKFYLRDHAQPNKPIPLSVQGSTPTGFKLRSADGSQQITATYTANKAPANRFSNVPVGAQSLVGLRLNKPNRTDPATPHTHQVSLQLELHREAASAQTLSSTVGLYLADAITGAVLNPKTGQVINSSLGLRDPAALNSYCKDAFAQAVWSTTLNKGTVSPTAQFTVSSNLNWDNLIAVPFVHTKERVGNTVRQDTYIGNETVNHDKFSRIAVIGNDQLGFEENFTSGVRDFSDVLLKLKSVVVV